MKCESCIYFNVYYRKGFFNFWQESKGVCGKSGNVESWYHSCEFFKRIPEIAATPETVENAIVDVKEIINFYCEDTY